jgi:hypothetical protein
VALKADAAHAVRWRGQAYRLRFGDVELELADDNGSVCRWPAVVGFSAAPLRYPILGNAARYPILGNAGCLCFFDALFRGADQFMELETNRSYPGTQS